MQNILYDKQLQLVHTSQTKEERQVRYICLCELCVSRYTWTETITYIQAIV